MCVDGHCICLHCYINVPIITTACDIRVRIIWRHVGLLGLDVYRQPLALGGQVLSSNSEEEERILSHFLVLMNAYEGMSRMLSLMLLS